MAYRFVAAKYYSTFYKARKAITIHMAEGGGTVSWLTHPDNDNSSHFVVEYDGDIVQMVSEKHSAHSLNPSLLRTNDDSAYSYLGESVRYGVTAAKKALGSYWYDPNAAVIAIEVEGYAKDGPNDRQEAALRRLVADLRSRWGALPCLGHRDFQNYKACPGHKIPWADYGGHGVATKYVASAPAEETPDTVNSFTVPSRDTLVNVEKAGWLYDNDGLAASAGNIQVDPGRAMPLVGTLPGTVRIVEYVNSSGARSGRTFFVKPEHVASTSIAPDATPFSQADLDKAEAAATAALQTTVDAQAETIATLTEKASLVDSLKASVETLNTQVRDGAAALAAAITERDAAIAAKEAAEAALAEALAKVDEKAAALKTALMDFLGLA